MMTKQLLAIAAVLLMGLGSILESRAGSIERRAPRVDRTPLDWREFRQGDVREIPDAFVEAHLRMELIRRATKTIDIVQYLQSDDGPVGMPLMSALRDAANRGVHVRFLVTATPQTSTDLLDKFRSHLLKLPTLVPIECLYFGPQHPWSMFDSIHEKFIIVDSKWAVTGGRAYGAEYLYWLDDGFAIKGQLVADIQTTYNRIWDFVTLQQHARTTPPLPAGWSVPQFRHFLVPPMMALSDEQQIDANNTIAWLDEAQVTGPSTGRARVLHFDMIQQRWMNHFPRNLPARAAQLEDVIISALVERISRVETRKILISSMSLIEHPALKAALVAAARRGVDVQMVTNNKKSDAVIAPLGLGYNWTISLPDMAELIEAGVRIHSLVVHTQGYFWKYLHKKMAIVDNDVFVGSHNFNYPSSLYNDETDLEIEDEGFAKLVRDRLEAQIASSTVELQAPELSWEMRHRMVPGLRELRWWLGEKMFPLF